MLDYDWSKVADAGLYTVPMAARLLAAKPTKVRSWVEGYGHSGAEPILRRDLPRIGGKTVLSFLDLVEAAFVRHFLAAGLSPQTIRKIATKLRESQGFDHPFATNTLFKANAKEIFEEVVTDEGERRLVNLMNDNFEIVEAVEPSLFDQIFYVADVARRWTPLASHPRIIVDPHIAFGRPVLKDVWVPTHTLFRSYVNEGGADEAAEEWNLAPEDILAAARFEHDLERQALH